MAMFEIEENAKVIGTALQVCFLDQVVYGFS